MSIECRFCFEAPCRCDELTYTPSLQEITDEATEEPEPAYFVYIPVAPSDDQDPDPFLTDLLEEPFARPVDKTHYRN